jgi:hypothetical protein
MEEMQFILKPEMYCSSWMFCHALSSGVKKMEIQKHITVKRKYEITSR